MLRDEEYIRAATDEAASVWPVLSRDHADLAEPQGVPAADRPAFEPTAAAPDVPAAVGGLLFASYMGLLGALAWATAGSGKLNLALAVCAFFILAFFAVPKFMFAQERPCLGHTSFDRFLAEGLQTYTGPCSGKAALVQMLIVPVLLTVGILMIGVIIAVVS